MNSKFTDQFEHWSHDGRNYTLDDVGKTMRYVNDEKKHIVAEIKLTHRLNNDDIYSATVFNLNTNEVIVQDENIESKPEAFGVLSRFMRVRDNTHLNQDN